MRTVNCQFPSFVFFCMVIVFCLPAVATAFERYNRVRAYDPYFSKYTKRFFGPAFDWRHFKAQAVAESRLRAGAKSRIGAVGLMQIMPATFAEIRRKAPLIKGPREQPRWNIAAGIYYDRQLWNTWTAKRPFRDRLNFTFGAYNAGKRNIIRAQRVAKDNGLDPNRWHAIEKALPSVTGKNSRETLAYVKKIEHITEVLH